MTHSAAPADDAASAAEHVRRWEASQRADIATARGAFESFEGRLDAAADWYTLAAETAPHDLTPLPFLASVLRAIGDPSEATVWKRLADLDPTQGDRAITTLTEVDTFLGRRPDRAQRPEDADLIMVLGFQLTRDGRPRDRLVRRLDTAFNLARQMPNALLLLSGGAVGGTSRSEASVMAKMLTNAGVSAHRILTERHSQDTLENVKFAGQFVQDEEAKSVVLVSEDPHLTRAAALLSLTGWFTSVAEKGNPVQQPFTRVERVATYRDALRLRGFLLPAARELSMENEFHVRQARRREPVGN